MFSYIGLDIDFYVDFWVENVLFNLNGLIFILYVFEEEIEINLFYLGVYNVFNVLVVIVLVMVVGVSLVDVKVGFE